MSGMKFTPCFLLFLPLPESKIMRGPKGRAVVRKDEGRRPEYSGPLTCASPPGSLCALFIFYNSVFLTVRYSFYGARYRRLVTQPRAKKTVTPMSARHGPGPTW